MSRRLLRVASLALVSAALPASGQNVPVRALVPDLTISGEEHEWSRVAAVHVAANGTIFVRHGGDHSISAFSPKGELMKKFGRTGAGPGEIRSASASGLLGDSLWVMDAALKRISIFDLEGRLGRTIATPGGGEWLAAYPQAKTYVSSQLMPMQLMPGDVAVGGGLVNVNLISAGQAPRLSLLRMTWGGVANGVVVELPFGHNQLRFRAPDMPGSISRQPFVSDPQLATSSAPVVVVADAVDNPAPAIRLTYIKVNGDTVRRARIPYTPQLVTKEMVDSAVAQIATTTKRVGHENLIRSAVVVPKYNWPIGAVILAADGTTWVQLRGKDPMAQWAVVSPQGQLVEMLTLPRSVEVRVIDRGIWGVALDENDVPSVVRYRRK